MTLEHSALIIIDIQAGIRGLFKTAQPNSWERVISNNQELVKKFKSEDQIVYLTSVQPKIFPKRAREKFGRSILGVEAPILIKHSPSAFDDTDIDLDKELKAAAIETLFICGTSTNNGVVKTARDAAKLGYNVIIIEDASAAKSAVGHHRVIEKEAPEFGKIIKTAEVLKL